MKPKPDQISAFFYILMVSMNLPALTYGTSPLLPTDTESLYCPGYANCAGDDCRYSRIVPTNDSKTFKKSNETGMTCDSLNVQFVYPDSKNESFVGNESLTCYRYQDAVGHHLAIVMITLNKPSDVETASISCISSIGNCTLLNETSSGLQYVAGLPDMCYPGTSFLPSETDVLDCQGYMNCTGDDCHFNRTLTTTTPSRVFYVDTGAPIKCDTLKLTVNYPGTNDTSFQGNDTFSCFAYTNGNGTSFPVAEMTLNKPSDVKGSGVSCTGASCVLQNELANQLVYYAGVPNNCTPWIPPQPETTTMAPTTTVTSPTTTAPSTPSNKTDTVTPATSNTTDGTTTPAGEKTNATTPMVETTTTHGKGLATNLEGTSMLLLIVAFFHFLSR